MSGSQGAWGQASYRVSYTKECSVLPNILKGYWTNNYAFSTDFSLVWNRAGPRALMWYQALPKCHPLTTPLLNQKSNSVEVKKCNFMDYFSTIPPPLLYVRREVLSTIIQQRVHSPLAEKLFSDDLQTIASTMLAVYTMTLKKWSKWVHFSVSTDIRITNSYENY